MISSPILPSPRDNPKTNIPSIYFIDAEIPSIFGSEENIIFTFSFKFKKFLIFFIKTTTSSLEKAFDKESIGMSCVTFLNFFEAS